MTTTDRSFSDLYEAFERSAKDFPERPALQVGEETCSYAELERYARRLGDLIRAHEASPAPLAAFLAYRSRSAYVATLGILESGKGYIPLNPNFPAERNRRMLEHSGATVLVVGSEAFSMLREVLATVDRPMTVICEPTPEFEDIAASISRHRLVRWELASAPAPERPSREVGPDSIAYLLFTSGSTGTPKGVAVSQCNVTSYVRYVRQRYGVVPEDRFSQTFDMTFDLSVHDMFVCWTSGACLCCLPQRALMAPAKFIRTSGLTMWFAVPSVAQLMGRMRMLKPGSFPGLRVSLFCGEALLGSSAEAWRKAAPNSVVENLYGPTEATIAIACHRWTGAAQLDECVNGVVPIGSIFPGQTYSIVDVDRNGVTRGQPGELCLSGSQVTRGYFNNPEKTREQFVTLPGKGGDLFYRTGDLVREDEHGCLHYLGRIDNQVQIRGYRVELQEVEHVLRQVPGMGEVVAVAWPPGEGCAEGIYAFRCGRSIDAPEITRHCQQHLPEYMVPSAIFGIGNMPLNVNGKVDRKALANRIGDLIHER